MLAVSFSQFDPNRKSRPMQRASGEPARCRSRSSALGGRQARSLKSQQCLIGCSSIHALGFHDSRRFRPREKLQDRPCSVRVLGICPKGCRENECASELRRKRNEFDTGVEILCASGMREVVSELQPRIGQITAQQVSISFGEAVQRIVRNSDPAEFPTTERNNPSQVCWDLVQQSVSIGDFVCFRTILGACSAIADCP